MLPELTDGRARNGSAVAYMLVAVASLSLIPLVVSWSGGAENPFLFNAGWRAGVALGCGIFIVVFHSTEVRSKSFWYLIKRRIFDLAILLSVIGNFEYALFAWSTRFLDISVVTVLYAVWPLFVILLMSRLFGTEQRYRPVTWTTVLLLIIGLAGYTFVIASQVGGFFGGEGLKDVPASGIFSGVMLAVAAAVVTSFAGFSFKWSSRLSREMTAKAGKASGNTSDDLFFLIVAYLVANSISAPVNAFGGMISGQTIQMDTLAFGVLGGISVQTVGSILWRKANFGTDNLGINALVYATPVFSLFWLLLFSQIHTPRADFLVIGTAAIVVANLLINFEAEIRLGFKGLLLALWGCGAFVYLRDDLLRHLPFDDWLWTGASYFEAVALSATVFILLLSFRVARLVSRIRDEDNRAFTLFQDLDLFACRGLVDPSIREHILDIDGSQTLEQLRDAYHEARNCLAQALAAELDPADRSRLTEAGAQLNVLAHSRQQGIEFGELFALMIFGGITVLLALSSRPDVFGWTGLLIEMFTALFSAVVVFLVINVWDLQRDRTGRILQRQPGCDGYAVVFRDVRSRRFEQWVSVVAGFAIAAAYAGLLWQKWLG